MKSLRQYSKDCGISYQTAWRHWKADQIPGAFQLPSGKVCVPSDWKRLPKEPWNVVLYAREIDGSNPSIDFQFSRLEKWALNEGWTIVNRISDNCSRLELPTSNLINLGQNMPNRILIWHPEVLGNSEKWWEFLAPDRVLAMDPTAKWIEPIWSDAAVILKYLVSRGINVNKAKLILHALK